MRRLWLSLFALLLLALAFGPALFLKEPAADEEILIISPHWEGIKKEFGRAFAEYYFEKNRKHVRVVWLDIGATGEIRKYLNDQFGKIPPEAGIGADILFGGGVDMLPAMAERNFFEPYTLSADQAKLIPAAISEGGQLLRDEKNRYHAACLSSFGFVYNKLVLEQARLTAPATWDDLGQPPYQGWISCGDPVLSGSVHVAFEVVLQGQGWESGCRTLARMISNTRSFNEGGSSVPRDVSLGQAAAGPCIDFYASAPIRRQGATHLQLVIPKGQAVATPDCIAMLRNPPNRAASQAFMDFVLSERGQRLWYQARGTDGGPKEYDLERLPVMPHIYDSGAKTYTVVNPFKEKPDFSYNSKKAGDRWGTLNDLWRGVMIDVHDELWHARKAVIAAGRDADLGAELTRAPLSEPAVMELAKKRLPADARNELRNRWSAWARTWHAEIESAARNKGAVPVFKPAPSE